MNWVFFHQVSFLLSEFSQLTCPAPVSQVACNGLRVYCSVAGSSHVFVYTCSDTLQVLEDVLQPGAGAGTIWSLQTGRSVLVGVTETSVIIWDKQSRDLVARFDSIGSLGCDD